MPELTRRGFLGAGLAGAGLIGVDAHAEDDDVDARLPIALTVDDQPLTARVHADDSALDLLRASGRTGVKQGCGHGACGACTVRCDGRTAVTCLLPATSLHGRVVQTVQGLGPALHPVQRAFLAEDALQCGYCTPGFVVEAVDFVERWWAEHGRSEPSADAVCAALAGHLSRCGAYAAIVRAVQGAAAGRFDGEIPEPPRADGLEKVTGAAVYTVDLALPGMLVGAVLRSPHANATLDGLDEVAARAIPGVRAVVRLLADGGSVRYAGQEIAAVAADDHHAAALGLRALAPRFTAREPVIGIDRALAGGAQIVWAKGERKRVPIASEAPKLPTPWEADNLRGPTRSDFFSGHRKAKRRLERSPGGVSGTWETAAQAHTALEPHAAVARFDGGRLEVWASTQATVYLAHDLAEHFRLRERDVVVRCAYVGGGFGGKAGLSIETLIAVKLAVASDRPVKVVLDRAEELAVGGFRPAQRIDLRLVADDDGALHALESDAYADQGVGVGTITGLLMRLIYPSRYKRLRDFDVLTHTASGKPFRAPGGPPAFFALEGAVDALADARGEDPLALRRRWDPNPHRQRLYDAVDALPWWRDRASGDTGRFRRGVGVAAATWFSFCDRNTQLELEWDAGVLTARTAACDMGNGARSAIAWAIEGALGLPRARIRVEVGDSGLVYGPLAAGSRTTASVVPAAEDAVEQLQELLVDRDRSAGRPDAIGPDGVTRGGVTRSWVELLETLPRTRVVGRRRRDPDGHFLPFGVGDTWVGKELPGSVQVSEVEVDTRIGRVRATRVWVGVAVGRIVAPPIARSQVEGGVVQGIGYALHEDRRLDPRSGVLLSAGLDDYRIPGVSDIPPIEVHFDEGGFDGVRGGGVGLAELCGTPCAASLANAVAAATGTRPMSLPIRPDRVLG